MSVLPLAVSDSATMLRRNLLHAWRYPSMTLSIVGMPIIFLLLFVYVFGGALGAGISAEAVSPNGDASYVNYVAPAILVMTVAAGAMPVAVSVCADMAEGIIARFRTMAIARVSVLTGHVVGSMIQTLLSLVVVTGLALVMGFRPTADPLRWIAVLGVIVALTFALTWLSVALGLSTTSPETASNLPLPLTLLPFIGSGFVPTDSMPAAMRWFAEYQPFTPVMETLRGLLMGTPVGTSPVVALGWCVGITLVGYLWARTLFDRDPTR